MKLTEIEIHNATSFGPEGVHLQPSHPVSALVGRNNAGKSNVFRMIDMCRRQSSSGTNTDMLQLPLRERTWHMGAGSDPLIVQVIVDFGFAEGDVLKESTDTPFVFVHRVEMRPKIDANQKWLYDSVVTSDGPEQVGEVSHAEIVQLIDRHIKWIPPLRHLTNENAQNVPNAFLNHDGTAFKTWLNDVLSGNTRQKQETAEAFLNDVRSIDGFERIVLTISAGDQGALNVLASEDGSRFATPIDECGAGLQMVLILLAAQHMTPGAVLLVDDIDNNLYPLAQENLAAVLANRAQATGGQVLYTTHSPAMLDSLPADAIFEVKKVHGVSSISSLSGSAVELVDTLRELGYRPSLLRLADAVVFVEGASDEVILRAWWHNLYGESPDPAIVFLHLGGSNMTKLRRDAVSGLGRAIHILLDSDRQSASADISRPAEMVVKNLSGVANVHVLKRRNIESYFSQSAVDVVLGSTENPVGEYDDLQRLRPEYRKGRDAAVIAENMSVDDIDSEIADFLRQVRDSAHHSANKSQ